MYTHINSHTHRREIPSKKEKSRYSGEVVVASGWLGREKGEGRSVVLAVVKVRPVAARPRLGA
jgi:hypothetical protein